MTPCILCHGPAERNRIRAEFSITVYVNGRPTPRIAPVDVCLDCSHTHPVTLAHLFDLARRRSARTEEARV